MLPFLLAQDTPPAALVGSWLAVAFYIAGGVTCCVVCWHHLTGRGDQKRTPQPLRVKQDDEFATKAELEDVKRQVAAISDKIERGFAALDDKRRTSIAGLHRDLDTKVGGLRTDVFSKTDEIETRIDAIPGRTIALLNETRQLHAKHD